MRVEPHGIDSIVHIVKRGARGMPIVRDQADRRRFVNLLWYANDEFRDQFWDERIAKLPRFQRPPDWPEKKPLVRLLAWTLMPNHFHLVIRQIRDEGMSKFMQQLCGSMTTHFNAKYDEKGSLFQGSYRGRTADIHGDGYLRNLAVYVMVKNPFELYRGGLRRAIMEFDDAFEWARTFKFCSLGEFMEDSKSLVIEKDMFGDIFESSGKFKNYARECMLDRLESLDEFKV